MSDTSDYQGVCSDCGKKRLVRWHEGSLTLGGAGAFCGRCLLERLEDWNSGRPIRPIGTKPKKAVATATTPEFTKDDEKWLKDLFIAV